MEPTDQNSPVTIQPVRRNAPKVLGILSIIFAFISPIIGVVLAIIGLSVKRDEVNPVRGISACQWGIGLSITSFIITLIILSNS